MRFNSRLIPHCGQLSCTGQYTRCVIGAVCSCSATLLCCCRCMNWTKKLKRSAAVITAGTSCAPGQSPFKRKGRPPPPLCVLAWDLRCLCHLDLNFDNHVHTLSAPKRCTVFACFLFSDKVIFVGRTAYWKYGPLMKL